MPSSPSPDRTIDLDVTDAEADAAEEEGREPGPDIGPAARAGFDEASLVTRCRRFAPLVDAAAYFAAVRRSLLSARRQVWILGWEIHSEIDLLRGEAAERAEAAGEPPVRLADLLAHLVAERPELHVRLLIWEGASLFAAQRQHLPRMKRPWADHPRIELVWDEGAPPLASRHQKIVAVDDRVAYVGGIDLTRSRWDTPEHRLHDRRRRPPGLIPWTADPYHDLMALTDGPAARVLADLARDRWKQATGETIEPPYDGGDAGETERRREHDTSVAGAGDAHDVAEANPADDAGDAGDDHRRDADADADAAGDAHRASADDHAADPWPDDVAPLFGDREHDLAIALTEPQTDPSGGRREVEATFLAQIASARRLIFIESQYFTAEAIVDALAERLSEPGGPEIVLILPWGCPQRIQAMAHDPHRDRLLDRLREADRDGRLGVYWVTRDGPEPRDPHAGSVYVHAKLLVIDDVLLRIGSANLNNRSMGLETECDVFIGALDDEDRAAIAGARRRMLGHLLDVDADAVAEAERDSEGRVRPAIDAVRGGRSTLVPFEHHAPEDIAATALPLELTDPDHPLSIEHVRKVMRTVRSHRRVRTWISHRWNALVGGFRRAPGRISLGILAVAAVLVLALTPVGGIGPDEAIDRLRSLAAGPTGLAGMLAGFVLLATIGAPVTVLLVALGVVQDGLLGVGLGLAGVLAAASAGRAIGGLAPGRDDATGPETEARDGALQRIARHVRRRGTLSVALIRNLPVAPFAVVNLACGVARVPWSAYLLGTAIGMLPGVVLLVLLGRGIAELLVDPRPIHLLVTGAVIAGVVGLTLLADRVRAAWVERVADPEAAESTDASAASDAPRRPTDGDDDGDDDDGGGG